MFTVCTCVSLVATLRVVTGEICSGRKGREGGTEIGRESGLYNYFYTRGQVLADTNLFHLTLVTDGVFFELLHNSLNIFSIRDPKCVNWGGWMTNTSVQ